MMADISNDCTNCKHSSDNNGNCMGCDECDTETFDGWEAIEEEWQPPADVKTWMVCAACRVDDALTITGPRHFDETMRKQMAMIEGLDEMAVEWEQGFIDQWGRFYNRQDAMRCVRQSGQPFDIDRNGGGSIELYSEGLY